jgi:hypothetical protein
MTTRDRGVTKARKSMNALKVPRANGATKKKRIKGASESQMWMTRTIGILGRMTFYEQAIITRNE